MVATSNEGAGVALAAGDVAAGGFWASIAGQARAIDAAVRRRDFRGRFRAGETGIVVRREFYSRTFHGSESRRWGTWQKSRGLKPSDLWRPECLG